MSKRGRPSAEYRPEEEVPCGVCRKTIRYDGLARHFKSSHPGKAKFVYKESKKQKTLTSILILPQKDSGSKTHQMQETKTRAELQEICSSKGLDFLEVTLFSDTRFAQYAYRTYEKFRCMFKAYYTLVERIASSDTAAAVDAQAELKKYQSPQNILRLSFMEEIYQLVKVASKTVQNDGTLPFHPKKAIERLIKQLEDSLTELREKQPPKVNVINEKLTAWRNFENTVTEIKDKGTFYGCPLLIPESRQRGVAESERMPTGIEAIIDRTLNEMKTYVECLIKYLHKRFQWPAWLCLTESAFDFSLDITEGGRMEALKELMELPSSPHPLTEVEKDRLCVEYHTLLLHAMHTLCTEKINSQEDLHYIIGTRSTIYKGCEAIIDFSLKFLSRPTNECIVESTFSMVADTDGDDRPLTQKNLEDICAIRMNGPHPLFSSELVKMTLNEKFGDKPWHFLVTSQRFFTSKAVSTVVNNAKNSYSLFD